jgi:uncharacterized protein (UPF0333 family)
LKLSFNFYFMQDNNSTTNAILVILIVVIVGIAVWYFAMHNRQAPAAPAPSSAIEVNLPGSNPTPAPTTPPPAAQ